MTTSTAGQVDLQDLIVRLRVEYAGAFSIRGKLQAVVCRANRRVPPASSVPSEARVSHAGRLDRGHGAPSPRCDYGPLEPRGSSAPDRSGTIPSARVPRWSSNSSFACLRTNNGTKSRI